MLHQKVKVHKLNRVSWYIFDVGVQFYIKLTRDNLNQGRMICKIFAFISFVIISFAVKIANIKTINESQ